MFHLEVLHSSPALHLLLLWVSYALALGLSYLPTKEESAPRH